MTTMYTTFEECVRGPYKGITEINLAGLGIGNDGVKALCKVLLKYKNLERLYLSNNKFTNEGVNEICSILPEFEELEGLCMRGNSIRYEGVQCILGVLPSLPKSMKKISLRGSLGNEFGDEEEIINNALRACKSWKYNNAACSLEGPSRLRFKCIERQSEHCEHCKQVQCSLSLYVGDLHRYCTEAEIFEVMRRAGPIMSIRLCRETIPGSISSRYAYLNYHNQADVRALEMLNYHEIHGKRICLKPHHNLTLRKQVTRSVFIKNLDPDVDNQTLFDCFCQFGNILSCKVSVNPQTQASRCYGLVKFESLESAHNAVEQVNGMRMGSEKKVYVSNFLHRSQRMAQSQAELCNCYVKGLKPNITEDEIRASFKKFGNVRYLCVFNDEQDLTFAFCSFETHEQAVAACEALHEQTIEALSGTEEGAKLYCVRAQKKKDEPQDELVQKLKARLDNTSRHNLYVEAKDEAEKKAEEEDEKKAKKEAAAKVKESLVKMVSEEAGKKAKEGAEKKMPQLTQGYKNVLAAAQVSSSELSSIMSDVTLQESLDGIECVGFCEFFGLRDELKLDKESIEESKSVIASRKAEREAEDYPIEKPLHIERLSDTYRLLLAQGHLDKLLHENEIIVSKLLQWQNANQGALERVHTILMLVITSSKRAEYLKLCRNVEGSLEEVARTISECKSIILLKEKGRQEFATALEELQRDYAVKYAEMKEKVAAKQDVVGHAELLKKYKECIGLCEEVRKNDHLVQGWRQKREEVPRWRVELLDQIKQSTHDKLFDSLVGLCSCSVGSLPRITTSELHEYIKVSFLFVEEVKKKLGSLRKINPLLSDDGAAAIHAFTRADPFGFSNKALFTEINNVLQDKVNRGQTAKYFVPYIALMQEALKRLKVFGGVAYRGEKGDFCKAGEKVLYRLSSFTTDIAVSLKDYFFEDGGTLFIVPNFHGYDIKVCSDIVEEVEVQTPLLTAFHLADKFKVNEWESRKETYSEYVDPHRAALSKYPNAWVVVMYQK